MSQRIVGDPFALEREAERNGQRSQLIIVALAIAQQKPSEGLTLPVGARSWGMNVQPHFFRHAQPISRPLE